MYLIEKPYFRKNELKLVHPRVTSTHPIACNSNIPTFQELFYGQKKFPKGWFLLSERSKTPISTQVTRIGLALLIYASFLA